MVCWFCVSSLGRSFDQPFTPLEKAPLTKIEFMNRMIVIISVLFAITVSVIVSCVLHRQQGCKFPKKNVETDFETFSSIPDSF